MPGEYTEKEVNVLFERFGGAKTIEEVSEIWTSFYEEHYRHLKSHAPCFSTRSVTNLRGD